MKLNNSVMSDLFLIFSFGLISIHPTWQSCVTIISATLLKGYTAYLATKKYKDQSKEIEEQMLSLRKEIAAVRIRIGLER